MKRKSIFCTIVAVVLVLAVFSTSAFALTVPNFQWQQSIKPSKIVDDSARQTTTGELVFDGVATSSRPGTFRLRLEKQGFWGWSPVGDTYEARQSSRRTYHERERVYVYGEYFRIKWSNLESNTTYRVVLYSASSPQQTTFSRTRIDIWQYGTEQNSHTLPSPLQNECS